MYYTNAPISPLDVWHAFAYQKYRVPPYTKEMQGQFINRPTPPVRDTPELALRKGRLLLRGKVIVDIDRDLADDPREMIYRFYVGDEQETQYQLDGYLKDIAGAFDPREKPLSDRAIKARNTQRDVERHEVLMHHLLKYLEGPGKAWNAPLVRALSEEELADEFHPVGMWVGQLAVQAEMPVEAVVEYIKAKGLLTISGVGGNRTRIPGAYQQDPNYGQLTEIIRTARLSYKAKQSVERKKPNPADWANIDAQVFKAQLLVPDTNPANPDTTACKAPTHCPIFPPIKLNYIPKQTTIETERGTRIPYTVARPYDARVWRVDRTKPLVPEYTCIMSNLARDCVEAKDDVERMKILRKAAEEKDPGNVDAVTAALWVMWQRRKV